MPESAGVDPPCTLDERHGAGGDPADVLVIGDAADAAAAAFVGARCVLYDGGSHPREELEALGRPVATSLLEALDLAEVA